MEIFAKLFESPRHGQILIKIDRGDNEEPEVRAYMHPEGFGVCCNAAGFIEEDDGWNKAQKLFDRMTLELAEQLLDPVAIIINEAAGE